MCIYIYIQYEGEVISCLGFKLRQGLIPPPPPPRAPFDALPEADVLGDPAGDAGHVTAIVRFFWYTTFGGPYPGLPMEMAAKLAGKEG